MGGIGHWAEAYRGAASVFGTTGEVVVMRVHFPYRR